MSSADGSVSGYAVQYDLYGSGGYDDTVLPGGPQRFHSAVVNYGWYTLTVIVRGSSRTLQVDGKFDARGQLPGTGNGIFIRVWEESRVELRTPAITTS